MVVWYVVGALPVLLSCLDRTGHLRSTFPPAMLAIRKPQLGVIQNDMGPPKIRWAWSHLDSVELIVDHFGVPNGTKSVSFAVAPTSFFGCYPPNTFPLHSWWSKHFLPCAVQDAHVNSCLRWEEQITENFKIRSPFCALDIIKWMTAWC